MFRFIFLIVFLYCFLQISYAQKKGRVEFTRWDTEILGVKELSFQCWDANGTFWAKCEKGLLSYNGYSVMFHPHIHGNQNSVLTDSIMRIFQGDSSELWISYLERPYITKLNPLTNEYRHYELSELTEEGVFKYPIVKTIKDHLGQNWILTWGKGLLKLDEKTGRIEHFDFGKQTDINYRLRYIKELTQIEGDEYLACFFQQDALPLKFNVKTGGHEYIDFEEYMDFDESLGSYDSPQVKWVHREMFDLVHWAYVDSDKNFWLGTFSGILFIDNKNRTFSRISEDGELDSHGNMGNCRVFQKLDDELWIGTTNMGIWRLDMPQKTIDFIGADPHNPTTLFDNRIVTMSTDPMGNIWICSEEGMASIYVPLTGRFEVNLWGTMRLDFESRSGGQLIPVNQVLVTSEGNVWISSGTGLQLYSPKLEKVIKHLNIGSGDVHDFWEHNVGNFKIVGDTILCLDDDHLVMYSLATQRNEILSDHSINESKLLFRHSNPEKVGYIFRRNSNEGSKIMKADLNSGDVKLIHEMGPGILLQETFTIELPSGRWLIHEGKHREKWGRFIIYDPIEKTHELYSPSSKAYYFPDSTVNIAYREGENIWIGCNSGLYLFDEYSGRSVNFNAEIGILDNEAVNAMIKDNKGKFWIALSQDILVWDQATGEKERYGKNAGLNVGSFLPAIGQKDKYGNVYFSTVNGVLAFNPSRIMYADFKFELDIDGISINEDSLDQEEVELTLKGGREFHWDDDYITFSYFSTQVFGSGQHQFMYRIPELGKKWVDNGTSNEIKLFNIHHGRYTLEVAATNSFGVESAIHRTQFSVKTPYWLATWFYLLIGFFVVIVAMIYVKIRTSTLKKRSYELENTVKDRTSEVLEQKQEAERQKREAEYQKDIVEEKQKEITDSIMYAKRIQDAILPSDEVFRKYLPKSFVMYRPKDIVAGDFYWMEPISNDEVIFAAADCTGHGVPGAIVSVVCNNALNRTVREFNIKEPGKLLDSTRELIVEQFEQSKKFTSVDRSDTIKDGMDISVCYFNRTTRAMKWAGANRPIWIMRGDKIIEIKGNKQPVGKFERSSPFQTHEIELKRGDKFYLFSDGFVDQFGGDKGKKYKSSSLKIFLLLIGGNRIDKQLALLEEEFDRWKGSYEQLDDVCIIGFQI